MLGILVNTLSVIIEYVGNLKNKFPPDYFFTLDILGHILRLKNRIDVHWAPVIFDFNIFPFVGFSGVLGC